MKLRITIETDNAAFADDGGSHTPFSRGAEVARILRALATKVDATGIDANADRPLYDFNGNNVGSMTTESRSCQRR